MVLNFALSEAWNFLPVLCLALWQTADILLDKWAESSYVVVSSEVVNELTRVGIAFLPYLDYAVVIHAFECVH